MTRRHDLPPALEDLGRRLTDAARQQTKLTRGARAARRRRVRRTVAGSLAAVLLPAGALAGAGLLDLREGEPLPEEARLAPEQVPARDPSVVPSSAVADPAGGPPWALKLFANAAGNECVALGRLHRGQLGVVANGRFQPLPQRVEGICGDLESDKIVLAAASSARPARTVIFGLTAGRQPLRVAIDGGRHSVRPGPLGTFLLVLRGGGPAPKAVVTTRIDGRRVVRRL